MSKKKDCSFCGKKRYSFVIHAGEGPYESKELVWKSDMIIEMSDGRVLKRVSVCPACRGKHTIQELYSVEKRKMRKSVATHVSLLCEVCGANVFSCTGCAYVFGVGQGIYCDGVNRHYCYGCKKKLGVKKNGRG